MPDYYVRVGLGETIETLPQFNALPADYYWIRSVDKNAVLIEKTDLLPECSRKK